jgi:hypothetical protein
VPCQARRIACQNTRKEHGADRGRDQFAPKVRYNVNAELAEQKSAEQRADEARDKVTNESTRRIGDLGGKLVPRTRSSHTCAASQIANFGFKKGH